MTKPLGTPNTRDQQDNHRTFYGHPIVVRVKDLTWQPPSQEAPPAQEDWVSNLLGEDPREASSDESSLVDVAPALLPTPVAASALQKVEEKPEPASPPTYLNHKNEQRHQRRSSILSGHWNNRLAMGGLAISLLIASFWMLSGGDTDNPEMDDVPQDLFVSAGELGDAPAWNAGESNADSSETITLEPLGREIPQMASAPSHVGAMSNPATRNEGNTEMTTISTPDSLELSAPTNNQPNPAWSNNPTPQSVTPNDTYIPTFGPSNLDYETGANASRTANSGSVPNGNSIPTFDGGQPSQAPSNYNSSPNSKFSTSAPNGSNPDQHWMQHERELISGGGTNPAANSKSVSPRLPVIQHGYSPQEGMPVINQPPQYAGSQPAAKQDNSGFGFDPRSNSYEAPEMPQGEVRRSASLTGVQPFESGTR